MKLNKKFNSSKGFTIIEVIVAAGLSSILILGLLRLIENQNKVVKALDEKMYATGIESQLKIAMTKASYCECLFRGKTIDLSDPSNPTWNQSLTSLPLAFSHPIPVPPTACTPTTELLVPSAGQKFSGTTIKVFNVAVVDMNSLGSGSYFANLEIQFDRSTLIRPIKNLKIPFSFNVDLFSGTTAARPVIDCGTSEAAVKIVNSSACPAGTAKLMGYSPPRTCIGSCGDKCTTGGWDALPCHYQSIAGGSCAYTINFSCNPNPQTKVLCQ